MNQTSATNDDQIEDLQTLLHGLESPTLLMQADPRQVVTANEKACVLFGKDLSQIEGLRGGQVFDCIHSFSEAGCGKDENCEDCKIKSGVVETFATGISHDRVLTVLDIRKDNTIAPYDMEVSTEKVGDFVIITIHRYMKKA